MSIERLGYAWRDLINGQGNEEDRALIIAYPEMAAAALAQKVNGFAPNQAAWTIGDYVMRFITDPELQAMILEQTVRIVGIQHVFPSALKPLVLGLSVPLLEVALRISRPIAIASVYTCLMSLKDKQDCVDWIIEHLGDCRPLMCKIARWA
jgi:hypothetical protein